MKYTKPKLYSFGRDVKNGANCTNGTGANSTSLDDCSTGGGASYYCGDGSGAKGTGCDTGHSPKPSSHHSG